MIDALLKEFRLKSTIFHRSLVCDNWQTDISGSGKASFHLILHGRCFVHLSDGRVEPLSQGDCVVFPHDSQHILTNMKSAQALSLAEPQFIAYSLADTTQQGATGLVCGYFDFGDDRQHPLLQSLPEVIIARNHPTTSDIFAFTKLLLMEAERDYRLGSAVLERLSEVFFLLLLRQLAADKPEQIGLLRAWMDPQLTRSLLAIRDAIGSNWTVENLANQALMSRSAFADKFRHTTGLSPIAYLTSQRMMLAKALLSEGKSVSFVAEQVGYKADAAFAKAFKKYFGYGPGEPRRN